MARSTYKEVKELKVFQLIGKPNEEGTRTVLETYSSIELANYASKHIYQNEARRIDTVEIVTGIIEIPQFEAIKDNLNWIIRPSGSPSRVVTVSGSGFMTREAELIALRIRDMLNSRSEEINGCGN